MKERTSLLDDVLGRQDWCPATPVLAVHGERLRIRCNDPELARAIGAAFGSLATSAAGVDPADVDTYSLLDGGSAEEPMRYALYRNDEQLVSAPTGGYVFASLGWYLNRLAVEAAGTDHVVLHAGAVAIDGRVVLLPARGESGKSTLTAGLVRAGFDYLSDEAPAIELGNATVHPFHKPITLDSGSWDVLPDAAPDELPPPAWRWPHWQVDARRLRPSARLAGPGRAVVVAFPRYERGSTTIAEPISRGEALLLLAQNSFNLLDHGQVGLATLRELVLGATCHRLTVGDLSSAVETVAQLSGQSPARST